MLKFEIRTVPWRLLWLEARGLMEAHAKEFAIPDLEAYIGSQQEILDAEARGLFDSTLMMDSSRTSVGYLCWLIGPHNGLPGARVARMGPWYVAPSARSRGSLRMFQHSLDSLRRRGATHALPTLPLKERQKETLGSGWLRRFRARPLEITWMIEL